jgi:CheY-like chemotaxis protein
LLTGPIALMPLFVPSHSLQGLRVLVLEDDRDMLSRMVETLRRRAAWTLAVETIADALVKVERFRPDVVVSDLGLADGEDGCEFARRLRALGRWRGGGVPAIALTGRTDPEEARRALTAGFDVHLGLPFDAEALAEAIVNVVDLDGDRAPGLTGLARGS